MTDRHFTLSTLQDLVRIDSRNPGLVDGAPGERMIAEYVHRSLTGMGWRPVLQDLAPGRTNVTAARGTAGPSLMINVHLDTVGVEGMEDPFGGNLQGGRVWGRGAQDIKGGVAAVLGAARALADWTPEGRILLAFVADEEHESLGTRRLLETERTDRAVVIEPTELDVCVGHRGYALFHLEAHGRTAHGGRSDLGVDANTAMARVLVALDRLRLDWADRHRHPLLGAASLHIPTLQGGRHPFVYADHCRADLECRTVPGQTQAGILEEVQRITNSLTGDAGSASMEAGVWRSPFQADSESTFTRSVLQACSDVRGETARTITHGWWEDSGLLHEAGIETLVLGPTGGGIHTEQEWVEVESVFALAEILVRIIKEQVG